MSKVFARSPSWPSSCTTWDSQGIPGGFVGVDLFFVISGFVITGLIWREIDRTGSVDLISFYARRMRRLLPASLLVIAFTVVVSSIVLSRVRFPPVAGDAVAATLYVSNIRFALAATDYLASSAAPSPLLHTWSLGVEEQFYLVWPVLLLVLSRFVPRRGVGLVLCGIAALSLAVSLVWTDVAAPWAFFSLPTRMWELAGGGLIAIGLLRLPPRFGFRSSTLIGGLGLVLLGIALLRIDTDTPFPGTAALLPVAGTMLLILSGARSDSLHARLLSTRVPRWLGRISYSLYLWHWPLLVLVPIWIGRDDLTTRCLLALVAVLIAAVSTELIEVPIREQRVLRTSARRSLVGAIAFTAAAATLLMVAYAIGPIRRPDRPAIDLVAAATASAPPPLASASTVATPAVTAMRPSPIVAAALSSVPTQTPLASVVSEGAVPSLVARTPNAPSTGPVLTPTPGNEPLTAMATVSPTLSPVTTPPPSPQPSTPGPTIAPSLGPQPTSPVGSGRFEGPLPASLLPSLEHARDDLPVSYSDGCHLDFAASDASDCSYGSTDPTMPLAMLIGDSHAAQWLPALKGVADDRGWRLIAITKSGCPFVGVTVWIKPLKREYRECDAWRSAVAARIAAEHPDVLVTAASRGYQVVDDAGRHPFAESLDAWRAGLTETLRNSGAGAAHVVLLADTPRLLADPVECLAAAERSSMRARPPGRSSWTRSTCGSRLLQPKTRRSPWSTRPTGSAIRNGARSSSAISSSTATTSISPRRSQAALPA